MAHDKNIFWLVMGVSGSGKSTVAQALAQQLDARWLDADDYHPRRNIERMSRGQALSDEDRWPWLAAIAEASRREHERSGRPVFLACSALKRAYRDFLRERLPGLRVLYLHGDEALIRARIEQRRDHYMGAGLLYSQFGDLESPVGEPGVDVVDIEGPLGAVLGRGEACVLAARALDPDRSPDCQPRSR